MKTFSFVRLFVKKNIIREKIIAKSLVNNKTTTLTKKKGFSGQLASPPPSLPSTLSFSDYTNPHLGLFIKDFLGNASVIHSC